MALHAPVPLNDINTRSTRVQLGDTRIIMPRALESQVRLLQSTLGLSGGHVMLDLQMNADGKPSIATISVNKPDAESPSYATAAKAFDKLNTVLMHHTPLLAKYAGDAALAAGDVSQARHNENWHFDSEQTAALLAHLPREPMRAAR
ncbi:MAG: hypothetical protein C0436_05600 [Alphaproteobacteria bacterium]|nr:hypothetical protein [Alphaproteobacteria bacterium]